MPSRWTVTHSFNNIGPQWKRKHGPIAEYDIRLLLQNCVLFHIDNYMKVKHTDDDPIYFDHYDAEALRAILDTQHKIIE